MGKREEQIARAAWVESDKPIGSTWNGLPSWERTGFEQQALAAVAKARELDTCETCKYHINPAHFKHGWCQKHSHTEDFDHFFTPPVHPALWGCAAHKPKQGNENDIQN